MNSRTLLIVLAMLAAAAAHAGDFTKKELNLHYVDGTSPRTVHGRTQFQSLELEIEGRSAFINRYLKSAEAGASLTVHSVTQTHQPGGASEDSLRGFQAYFFVRQRWREGARLSPYVGLGTGPMFTTRRVPAEASRFNMSSQIDLALTLFSAARFPVTIGYRFSHVSDGGLASRNPGLSVDSIVIGTRLRSFPSR